MVNVIWLDIVGKNGINGYLNWASKSDFNSHPRHSGTTLRVAVMMSFSPRGDTFDTSKVWCSTRHLGDAGKTAPVIRNERVFENRFGLIDMAGNVNEQTVDTHRSHR